MYVCVVPTNYPHSSVTPNSFIHFSLQLSHDCIITNDIFLLFLMYLLFYSAPPPVWLNLLCVILQPFWPSRQTSRGTARLHHSSSFTANGRLTAGVCAHKQTGVGTHTHSHLCVIDAPVGVFGGCGDKPLQHIHACFRC